MKMFDVLHAITLPSFQHALAWDKTSVAQTVQSGQETTQQQIGSGKLSPSAECTPPVPLFYVSGTLNPFRSQVASHTRAQHTQQHKHLYASQKCNRQK